MLKIKLLFHIIQLVYYSALLEGCLDKDLERKFCKRIRYHKKKINEIKNFVE